MKPFVVDRPIVMQRFPDGIDSDGFFHKAYPDHFPDWIDSVVVKTDSGEKKQVVINNAATLVYLANFGCITPHIWLSRTDRIDKPDRVVFDLDPPGDDFSVVRETALHLRKFFDDLDVVAFAQVTGSSGMHVVVPLRRENSFDEVRTAARRIAELLRRRHSKELTLEQHKEKRQGRLFLDVGRNAYGQTMAAPYCLRAKQGAPVVTPVEWEEVESGSLFSRSYTMKNIVKRMGQRDDPWRGMQKRAVALSKLTRQLGDIEESEQS